MREIIRNFEEFKNRVDTAKPINHSAKRKQETASITPNRLQKIRKKIRQAFKLNRRSMDTVSFRLEGEVKDWKLFESYIDAGVENGGKLFFREDEKAS